MTQNYQGNQGCSCCKQEHPVDIKLNEKPLLIAYGYRYVLFWILMLK